MIKKITLLITLFLATQQAVMQPVSRIFFYKNLQPTSQIKEISKKIKRKPKEIKPITIRWEQLLGKSLPERVTLLRENMNHTYLTLADEILIGWRTLSRFEKGGTVNHTTIKKILGYFKRIGVNENWLYGFTLKNEDLVGKTFRERVKLLRENLGWSYLKMAEVAIVDEGTVRRIENLEDDFIPSPLTKNKFISAFKKYGAPDHWFIDEVTLSAEDFVGKTFGQKVEMVRKNLCWEKQVLARELSIHHATISGVENEHKHYTPSKEMVKKFVDLFVLYGAEEEWFEDDGRFERVYKKIKETRGSLKKEDIIGFRFGLKILLLRTYLGLKQGDVASDLQMSTQTVCLFEKGVQKYKWRKSTLLKLVRYFGEKGIPEEWVVHDMRIPGITPYKVRYLFERFDCDLKEFAELVGLNEKHLKKILDLKGEITRKTELKLLKAFEHYHAMHLLELREVTLTKEFLEGRSIGQRIKFLRLNLDWTYEQFFEAIQKKVSIGTLRNIESGRTKRIQRDKLISILSAFKDYGVTEDWFYDSLREEDIKGLSFKKQINIFRNKLKLTLSELASKARIGESALRKINAQTLRSTKEKLIDVFLPFGARKEWFEGFDGVEELGGRRVKAIHLEKEEVSALEFHERIRVIREAIGLSRSELAELAGLTKTTLNSIETRPLKRAMITTYKNLGLILTVFAHYGVTSDWFEDLKVFKPILFSEHVKSVPLPNLFEIAI